jgi:hypothetical protein
VVTLCVVEVGQRLQTGCLHFGESNLPVSILVNDLKDCRNNVIRLSLVFLVVLNEGLKRERKHEHADIAEHTFDFFLL